MLGMGKCILIWEMVMVVVIVKVNIIIVVVVMRSGGRGG
jgi:hypothetical protein